jgi:hypothetical protein
VDPPRRLQANRSRRLALGGTSIVSTFSNVRGHVEDSRIVVVRANLQAATIYSAVGIGGCTSAILTLATGPPGRGRSWPFTPERAGACKNLQAVPKRASTIGIGRPTCGTADPDFPESAAICGDWHRPVTPEAAGSSPVDPANYQQVSYLH